MSASCIKLLHSEVLPVRCRAVDLPSRGLRDHDAVCLCFYPFLTALVNLLKNINQEIAECPFLGLKTSLSFMEFCGHISPKNNGMIGNKKIERAPEFVRLMR
jgi:hypothetical protein